MTQLIVVERSVHAWLLIKFKLVDPDALILITHRIGLWNYKIPKLSFSNIPYTDSPSEFVPASADKKHILLDGLGNAIFSSPGAVSRQALNATYYDLLKCLNGLRFDDVLVVIEHDREGIGQAEQILSMITSIDLHSVRFTEFTSWHAENITSGWKKSEATAYHENKKVQKLANSHKAKRLFDHWWFSNSQLVFSELCSLCGLSSKNIVSKYEIMLLVLLSKYGGLTPNSLTKIFNEWSGSGKFKGAKDLQGIGSAASQCRILDNAINRGAIHVGEYNKLVLSGGGARFVASLHPKTFDPDLRFRLYAWSDKQDYAAMKRYINTVFGRQLRYQRKLAIVKGFSLD